jgi:hypothetical protein
VSKNHGLGKPDHRQRSAHGAAGQYRYHRTINHETAPKTLICRYTSVAGPDNVSRSSAVSASFVPLVRVLNKLVRVLKKKLKTTLDRPAELR